MAAPVVGIVGLAALRRDLKHLTDDEQSAAYKAIRAAGKESVEPVAGRARSTVAHDTGRVAGTIRTSGTRTGGAVRMGSARAPYAGWLDFGGNRSSPHESTREYVAGGRYLFPAAEGLASVAATRYAAALQRVFDSGGVWTNTTNDGGAVHD